MKTFGTILLRTNTETTSLVNAMSRYELDDLEEAIYARRLELIAAELYARGIPTRISTTFTGCDGTPETILFNMVCVYDPASELHGEWATVSECRRLLDTVANLKPAEAFRRWRTKIEPLHEEPYTKSDAVRDTRAEREQLHRDYADGKMSGADFALAMRFTNDYFKYVEK